MNDIPNSKDYMQFLNDIKKDAKESQFSALVSQNKEMINLFYRIGKGLLEKQSENNWGAECIKQLAIDLKHDFPGMKAFSLDELKTMRIFAGHFSRSEISSKGIGQMPWEMLKALLTAFDNKETVIWYVQKCLEEGWGLDSLLKGMEEKIHIKQMIS